MSKTDASSEPLPQLQFPSPEQSPKPECVPVSDQDDSCRTADTESLSQLELSALRALFELLDEWDKEIQHGD